MEIYIQYLRQPFIHRFIKLWRFEIQILPPCSRNYCYIMHLNLFLNTSSKCNRLKNFCNEVRKYSKKGHIPDSYLLGLVNSSCSFTYLQQLRFGGLFGFDCRHFQTSGPLSAELLTTELNFSWSATARRPQASYCSWDARLERRTKDFPSTFWAFCIKSKWAVRKIV